MADIQKIQAVQDSVNSVIKGKEDVVKKVFAKSDCWRTHPYGGYSGSW